MSKKTNSNANFLLRLDQEKVVFFTSAFMFIIFSIFLDRFFTYENIINLVRNISVLGLLSLGMAIVVIGRGVDLAIVAVMAVSMTLAIILAKTGYAFHTALFISLLFAIFAGALSGCLVAYGEISPIFATIAMLSIIYGLGSGYITTLMVNYVPEDVYWFSYIGNEKILTIPISIWIFALAALLIHLLLKSTGIGKYFYAVGDNLEAARITGIPVRPVLVGQYIISSIMAFLAGFVTAASVGSMNIRMSTSTIIYDVLLVVVLGGIGLSGGRGGVRNVLVGAILIGLLLNGMTIMDINYTVQNLLKSSVLLAALVVNAVLNPRDEQTSQQGDI